MDQIKTVWRRYSKGVEVIPGVCCAVMDDAVNKRIWACCPIRIIPDIVSKQIPNSTCCGTKKRDRDENNNDNFGSTDGAMVCSACRQRYLVRQTNGETVIQDNKWR